MRVSIEANPKAHSIRYEGDSPRCRQLLKSFIGENYIEALLQSDEIQRFFAQWLKERDNHASRETQKQELKHLHRMAQQYPELATLEAELEGQRIDLRNNVARKSIKVSISRIIGEGFLKRMQDVINSNANITAPMENGFIVFSATLMTGLRPTEWWWAELYRAHENPHCLVPNPTLRVRTAKTKPEQEQQWRDLVLEGFGEPQIGMIRSAIEVVGPLTKVQHGYLSNGLRRVAMAAAESPEEQEVVQELDIGAARKLYAVEALREGRGKRKVAGALGHTSDGNLRHYSEGDIYRERMMRYPLATITEQAELEVKEILRSFLSTRQGQTPTTPDSGIDQG